MTPPASGRISRRPVWNCVIAAAGVGYIALALVEEIESPWFAFAVVGLAIYEMWTSHASHHNQ